MGLELGAGREGMAVVVVVVVVAVVDRHRNVDCPALCCKKYLL